MALHGEGGQPTQQGGPRVVVGSFAVVAMMVVIGLAVLAIGYFTVIQVFGVPWYAAVPLSLIAGAGILMYEMSFSWKAWLAAAVLVAVAAFAAFGWWFTDAMG